MTKKEHTTITELFQVWTCWKAWTCSFGWMEAQGSGCLADSKPACIEILTLILMPIIQTNSLSLFAREYNGFK